MVSIRPTLPGDTWLILSDLRPEEVAEFDALGVTSEQCMRLGLMYGNAETLFIHDEPAGILGLVDYGEYQMPWAVWTTVIERYPLAFLRFTKRWAKEHLTGTALNYVDVRNERAVKWFSWLGFEVSEPEPYGPNGKLFRQVRVN